MRERLPSLSTCCQGAAQRRSDQRRVLHCMQCVAILVNYLERPDWQAAFEATVPQRKRAAGPEDNGDLKIDLEEIGDEADEEEEPPGLGGHASEQERERKRLRTDDVKASTATEASDREHAVPDNV